MTRSNKATGALLAIAGIATVTAGSTMTGIELLAGALLLLGTAATVGGITLASKEVSHG